jgi:PqqD family protein of HPr-rel-A system
LTSARRWRLVDPDLVWRSWPNEDEAVLYSPASGDVHLLNLAARRLIELAAEAPKTAQELAAALGSSAPQEELLSSVAATIEMLDGAGILEPDV